MFEDFESDVTRGSLIYLTASLSPKAFMSLDKESYRESAYSDGSTDEWILEALLQDLMIDLNEIGLTFEMDLADLVDDLNKTSQFLQLASYLLPNTLYDLIKHDSNMRHLIESVVDGSLGDNESAIQIYLSELAGLNGTLPLKANLVDFIDQMYTVVTQTSVFTDYLKNLLFLHRDERPSLTSDDERNIKYRDVVRNLVGHLSDAVNSFDNYPEYEELVVLQNFVIRDFTAPDNFINYAYLLLEDKTTLPEDLHLRYDQKWYHYRASHPWMYDYYLIRRQEIDPAQQIMIACMTHALSQVRKESYKENIKLFRERYKGDKVDGTILSLIQE